MGAHSYAQTSVGAHKYTHTHIPPHNAAHSTTGSGCINTLLLSIGSASTAYTAAGGPGPSRLGELEFLSAPPTTLNPNIITKADSTVLDNDHSSLPNLSPDSCVSPVFVDGDAAAAVSQPNCLPPSSLQYESHAGQDPQRYSQQHVMQAPPLSGLHPEQMQGKQQVRKGGVQTFSLRTYAHMRTHTHTHRHHTTYVVV